jgi:hypothetical protein
MTMTFIGESDNRPRIIFFDGDCESDIVKLCGETNQTGSEQDKDSEDGVRFDSDSN